MMQTPWISTSASWTWWTTELEQHKSLKRISTSSQTCSWSNQVITFTTSNSQHSFWLCSAWLQSLTFIFRAVNIWHQQPWTNSDSPLHYHRDILMSMSNSVLFTSNIRACWFLCSFADDNEYFISSHSLSSCKWWVLYFNDKADSL